MIDLEILGRDPVELEISGQEPQDMEVGSSIVIRRVDGGMPPGGAPGDIIIKRSAQEQDAEWTAPAQRAEADNTLPITSAAVYTEIGNINALLATI